MLPGFPSIPSSLWWDIAGLLLPSRRMWPLSKSSPNHLSSPPTPRSKILQDSATPSSSCPLSSLVLTALGVFGSHAQFSAHFSPLVAHSSLQRVKWELRLFWLQIMSSKISSNFFFFSHRHKRIQCIIHWDHYFIFCCRYINWLCSFRERLI